jgi:hypothetical protein
MGYFRIIEKVKDIQGIEKEIEKFRFKANMPKDEKFFPNHFVNSGKQMVLDFMFNNICWLTGATWNGTRYVGVGNSTNTNAGVTGPSGAVTVPYNGAWAGVDDNDWKLTNEIGIAREPITVIRAGKTVYLRTKMTDSDFTDGITTSYDILEVGIFCSGQIGLPNADPTQSTLAANKNSCMLVRGVSYYNNGSAYQSRAITKVAGSDLYIDYVFADFEG